MRINNNIMAMNANRQLGVNNSALSKSLEKLSSGYRINRAGDDAAGLAISEKMRGQIRGLNQASRNAQDGISLIQTAEGALQETHAILQRMRELVVQAGNLGTNQDEDLQAIQDEIDALKEELGGQSGSKGIADRTQFNGKSLLDGSESSGFTFQIGANKEQQVTLIIGNMKASALGKLNASGNITSGRAISDISVTSGFNFNDTIEIIDDAIKTVSKERSNLGAVQNRLEHTIRNLDNAAENLTAAESRIRDVDMAKEMMEFTKQSILQQASTAMLAQANQLPGSVLKLLG